jgi:hypothetical protein
MAIAAFCAIAIQFGKGSASPHSAVIESAISKKPALGFDPRVEAGFLKEIMLRRNSKTPHIPAGSIWSASPSCGVVGRDQRANCIVCAADHVVNFARQVEKKLIRRKQKRAPAKCTSRVVRSGACGSFAKRVIAMGCCGVGTLSDFCGAHSL